MFNGGTLNNHIVSFEENTVKNEKGNTKSNLIYLLNLQDKTPQIINIINNNIYGYKLIWNDPSKIRHNIKLENN